VASGRADPAAALLAFREHAQSLVLPPRRIAEMPDALLEPPVLGLVARGGGAIWADAAAMDLPALAQAAGCRSGRSSWIKCAHGLTDLLLRYLYGALRVWCDPPCWE